MSDALLTDVAHGLGHELRRQLLADFPGPNTKTAKSPNDLSKKLGEPLTNVSYHVRMLLDKGLILLVETEPRRGALEHYYRRTQLGQTALVIARFGEKKLLSMNGSSTPTK